MIREQHKYCGEILKALKRHPDAGHFLEPVDPVKLNVPDYPDIIRNPMDLKTMERKLNDCRYDIVDQFIADMRLIFDNCYLYNGKDSIVGSFAQNLERVFNNRLKKMPQGSQIKRLSPPILDDLPIKPKPKAAKRDSVEPKLQRETSVSQDSRRGSNASSQSKRKAKRSIPDIQYKFCLSIIKELHKKRHANYAYPFLEPVDWEAMNLPDYPNIIKQPMDISTIKKKLESGAYHNINDFEGDIRLMLENCYTYNPVNNPVYNMGKSVEKVFDSMWAQRPPLPPPSPKEPSPEPQKIESEESSHEVDKDTRTEQIAEMQRHIEFMTRQLASMKDAAKDKKKEKKPKSSRMKSSSQRDSKSTTTSSKGVRKKVVSDDSSDDDDVPAMTFEQKQELSDNINLLSSDKLDVVINLIRSSMPELNEGDQDEIELDIDSLDKSTLYKLYKFVKSNIEPKRGKHLSKAPKHEHLGGKRKRRLIPDESSSSSSSSGSDSSSSSSGSDSEHSPIPPRKRSSLARPRSPLESSVRSKDVPSGNKISFEAVPIDTLGLDIQIPKRSKQVTNGHKSDNAVKIQNVDRWAALVKDAESNKSESEDKAVDPIWAKYNSELKAKREQHDKIRAEVLAKEKYQQEEVERQKRLAQQRREEEAKRMRAERLQMEERRRVVEKERSIKREYARSQRLADAKHSIDLTHQALVMAAFERDLFKDREARERERVRFMKLMTPTSPAAASPGSSQAESPLPPLTPQSHSGHSHVESEDGEIVEPAQH
ncbi:hypothetical protein K7432_001872 [Basidiobolus ranarum]|uniref:Bromodomain-containing protein n=1 Tax=Basidiobolus ranarum TaxID=34480 RepID=A0ABR2W8X4_9FUNG